MDLNEQRGRVLRVNLARPQNLTSAVAGNRASKLSFHSLGSFRVLEYIRLMTSIVWESEEWLKQYAKPLAKSGGVGARAAIRAGQSSVDEKGEENADEGDGDGDDAMEE